MVNSGIVMINNCPRYGLDEEYIVARESDGELWFYGNYPERMAREVAREVGGVVVRVRDEK